MPDIFLSYSSKEPELARPYVDAFESLGWTVFWDRKIQPGQTWDEAIESNLDQATCVVVLWSMESRNSNWVKSEARQAAAIGNYMPVMATRHVNAPLGLDHIQWQEMAGWSGNPIDPRWLRLVGRLEERLGGSKAIASKDSRATAAARLSDSGVATATARLSDSGAAFIEDLFFTFKWIFIMFSSFSALIVILAWATADSPQDPKECASFHAFEIPSNTSVGISSNHLADLKVEPGQMITQVGGETGPIEITSEAAGELTLVSVFPLHPGTEIQVDEGEILRCIAKDPTHLAFQALRSEVAADTAPIEKRQPVPP